MQREWLARSRMKPVAARAVGAILASAIAGAVVAAAASAIAGCSREKPLSERLIESARLDSPSTSSTGAAAGSGAAAASAARGATPREGPPRPLPKGEWGPIQVTAPLDVQQKALAYTYAMASPGPDDPPVDKAFSADAVKKIEIAARTADQGDKRLTRVASIQGDRKIQIELGGGCTQKTPANIVAQRAGLTLAELARAGILAIECHDAKWKCIQATRDPDDVLCVVAPRR